MEYGTSMLIKLMKKLICLLSMKSAPINCLISKYKYSLTNLDIKFISTFLNIDFKLLARNTNGNSIKMMYGE